MRRELMHDPKIHPKQLNREFRSGYLRPKFFAKSLFSSFIKKIFLVLNQLDFSPHVWDYQRYELDLVKSNE